MVVDSHHLELSALDEEHSAGYAEAPEVMATRRVLLHAISCKQGFGYTHSHSVELWQGQIINKLFL